MNDKPTEDKNNTATLKIKPLKLSLSKNIENSGLIKQNFAHGRSKIVTVEVKKRRGLVTNNNESSSTDKQVNKSFHKDTPNLTDQERTARLSALLEAAKQEEQANLEKQAIQIEQQAIAKELIINKDTSEANQILSGSTSLVQDSNIETKVDKQDIKIKAISKPSEEKNTLKNLENTDDKFNSDESSKSKKFVNKSETKVTSVKNRWEEGKRKISINNVASDEDNIRTRSLASIKRAREKAKRLEAGNKESEKIIREVILPEFISVQELANRMATRSKEVIKELMKLGTIVTLNQELDADTAELIVQSFGHKVKRVAESDIENSLIEIKDTQEQLLPRAPVVTIMGHVDHGKTSLLDALRSTDVAANEAGGITQHIGAYQIKLANNQFITLLDTPGHEAFTAMRSRGAKATDIVILVVAADDGIMAQTIEAINHAKAASVPIIVAINKIDKVGADSNRIRSELLIHDLVPEELGGDTIVVEVSAKQKLHLDKLEETILLQAEILDLKANPNRQATGVVIESKIDRGRGITTTILIQNGHLKVGDIVIAGNSFGKVKIMNDDKGRVINNAYPSMPIEILGLSEAPEAGEKFSVVQTEKQAREIVEYRNKRLKAQKTSLGARLTLEQMFSKSSAGAHNKELPLIIKTDVHGSLEAISNSLMKIDAQEVSIKILHSGVGGITESDVTLAKASNAIILGFNTRATVQSKINADRDKIDIRYYSIIYNLIDDIKAALSGMLSPILREEYLGSVEIRQVFNITKAGKIAGSFVTSGIIKKGAKVRLLRDNIVIHEGKLKTLKRFKDDVKEVKEGYECGIAFENYENIKEKDTVEVFEIIEEKQVLK